MLENSKHPAADPVSDPQTPEISTKSAAERLLDIRRCFRRGVVYVRAAIPRLPLFPLKSYPFTLGAFREREGGLLGVGSRVLPELRLRESNLLTDRVIETARQLFSAGGPDILLDPPTPLLSAVCSPEETPAFSAYVQAPPEDPPVDSNPRVVLLHYVALQCYFADAFRLPAVAFFRLRSLSSKWEKFPHLEHLIDAMRRCNVLQNRLACGSAKERLTRVGDFLDRYASQFPREHQGSVKKVFQNFLLSHLESATCYLQSLLSGSPLPYPSALEFPPPAPAPIEVNSRLARLMESDRAAIELPDRSVAVVEDSRGEIARKEPLARLPREVGVRAASGRLPFMSFPLFPDSGRYLFQLTECSRGRISRQNAMERVSRYLAVEQEVYGWVVKVWEERGRDTPARDKDPVYFRRDGQLRALFFYIDPAELPSKEELAAESDPQRLEFYHRAVQCAIAERMLSYQLVCAASVYYRNRWQRLFRPRGGDMPREEEYADWKSARETNHENFTWLTHVRASLFRKIVSDLKPRLEVAAAKLVSPEEITKSESISPVEIGIPALCA